MINIVEETRCRVCGGELSIVLDLGNIYPSAFLKEGEKMSEDEKAPLTLAECGDCGLVQLKHTVDLDRMYRQYWYASSLNKSMVNSLADIVNDVEGRINIEQNDALLDIGCNDGTLLKLYKTGVGIGFDPALNIKNDVTLFINDYFSAEKYPKSSPKAKVITAIAMFYDLPDPHQFVEDVKEVLHEDGIFVVQFTDLLSMIKVTAFDNICHEHLEYYTAYLVHSLLETHGLEVIDISYNDVNGGSVRITAGHEGRYPVSDSVATALKEEENFLKLRGIKEFKESIKTTVFKIKELLGWAKFHNHAVYLLGASTKGNTLLQICEITDLDIPFAAEVNKDKFGLRTAGSDIEIISELDALIKHPAYFLVPVWHFKKSILSNPKIRYYLESGGKLIFPLPYFHVVYTDYSKNIQEVVI